MSQQNLMGQSIALLECNDTKMVYRACKFTNTICSFSVLLLYVVCVMLSCSAAVRVCACVLFFVGSVFVKYMSFVDMKKVYKQEVLTGVKPKILCALFIY